MKSFLAVLLGIFFSFISCKDDSQQHEIEITRAKKEKELVFNNINKAWSFNKRNLTPESQSIASNWNEWRLFTDELYQKPKSTIGAFQRKTKSLVSKTDALQTTIPSKLDKTQIRSRLSALITKVKALNTFISLDRIPEKKVLALVSDLNLEVNAFQDQIEEIVRRSQIQLEEGEAEMIKRSGGTVTAPTAPAHPPLEEEVQSFEEIK
jgi:hypothetical protein